jgi:hypothetical protein
MKPPSLKDYIFAQEKDRELVTIRRLFADQGGLLGHWFEPVLRWSMPFVWLGLRIPHERLLRGYKRPPKKFLGDVDVFGASLQASSVDEYRRYYKEVEELFTDGGKRKVGAGRVEEAVIQGMISEGKTKWPPDFSYIAATEVKAAYYSADADLKAAGNKHNGRTQASELCEMGFDRVALARFVVTEPVDVPGHHPWMVAGARSSRAMDEYLDEPKGILVKEDDPFGTVLVSDGSVLGKLEHHAGSTSAEWLKNPPDNPYRERAAEVRKVIEENLTEVMSRHPFPRTFPVLILACSDNKCGNLYVSGAYFDFATGENHLLPCPDCGKPPR